MRFACLLLLLLAAGASEEQVRETVLPWLDARQRSLKTCRNCGGLGQKQSMSVGNNQVVETQCPTCEGWGLSDLKNSFELLHWKRYSNRYRTPERRKDPKQVHDDGLTIDSWHDLRIEVYGTLVVVKVLTKRDKSARRETWFLIEDPAGTWRLRHPEADAAFPITLRADAK
jgi:hypothetical protein